MRYRVTYVLDSDAPDVLAFQTPEKPGEYTPLNRALMTAAGRGLIESLTVEALPNPESGDSGQST